MVKIPRTSLEQPDIERTLQLILKNAVKTLDGSAGVVAVWNEAEHRFVLSVSCGLSSQGLSSLNSLLDEAVPDLANSRDSFNLLSTLQPDLELPLSGEGVRQNPILALPLRIGENTIGLIYILRNYDASPFSRFDQPVLAGFAEQAAVAVQNSRLAFRLAEEKLRIESILENSADGIMGIDSLCRILDFNSAMEKLTGFSRKEVLGKECFRILNFGSRDNQNLCNTQCPMKIKSINQRPVFELEGTIQTRDGRTVNVTMVYSIVRSEKGQPINAVINVRDNSKTREIENLRDTILSMLGHELKTPLTIIKGYTSTLNRTDNKWDEDTIRQGLQAIEEECDRLSQVMNKLILASRLSAGSFKLEKEPIELSTIANKVVRRFRGLEPKHDFLIDFEKDFPAVMAEPSLLEQVLTNLVDNSVKYSPSGGKVTISGQKSGDHVSVTVSDQGLGIPIAEMEHLFQKFHRVEKGRARKIQGTGLGLYICKAIIEAHGGTLEAASQLGKGSQFTFTLPVDKPE